MGGPTALGVLTGRIVACHAVQPLICTNETCQNRSNWELLVDESRFADWQRVRVQENSSEIPAGSMPRRQVLCAVHLSM